MIVRGMCLMIMIILLASRRAMAVRRLRSYFVFVYTQRVCGKCF